MSLNKKMREFKPAKKFIHLSLPINSENSEQEETFYLKKKKKFSIQF